MLNALSVLSKSSIVHGDLKPENILLSDTTMQSIKLIDFGTSCFTDSRIYTYIQSRYYRAPEIILGIPYTSAIDMWSFGCILVELYLGIPIFPANNEQDLLYKIIEVIGMPPLEIIKQGTRSLKFFNDEGVLKVADNKKTNFKEKNIRNIKNILKDTDGDFAKLIDYCLKWDPKSRITSENALKSSWYIDSIQPEKPRTAGRCKIRIEDITKNTPKLKTYIDRQNSGIKKS